MPPSWRLALNDLVTRRTRSLLLAGAVALAASLIVVVSCSIASVRASVEQSLTRFIGASDARIIHPGSGYFPDDLEAEVRAWPEVRLAAGRLGANIPLVHPDGPPDPETGRATRHAPRAIGIDFDLEPRFRHIEVVEGRMPAAAHEILIDPLTAELLGADVGDVLEVPRVGESVPLTVTGVFDRPIIGTLQHPIIYVDRVTLGDLADQPHQLTSLYIILDDAADVPAFCDRYREAVPRTLVLEPAELVRTGFDQRIRASRIGLIITSLITFIAAGFIIVTGLTTGVTERQRQLALLRCVGARRRQLFAAQLLGGVLFGVVGAVAGLPIGLALTKTLVLYFREYLPAGLTIHGLGLALAVIGSLAAGTLGAVYPAAAASRVTPLRAMSSVAAPPRASHIALCGLVGVALIGVQLLLHLPGDSETRFWTYASAGLPCVLVGFFLLSVPAVVLVTVALGGLLSRGLGLPAGLLRGSVLATPFRHGFTAGALMIGMAILVDTWAAGASLVDDWIAKIEFADGFAFRSTGITPEQQARIAALPFVEEVCPIGYLPVRLVGRQVFGLSGLTPPNVVCIAFDPDRFFAMNTVEWLEGDPGTAIERLTTGEGLIVAERFLTAKNVGVGDHLTLEAGQVARRFQIVGVVNSAGLDIATQLFGIRDAYMQFAVSCVFVDDDTVAELFDHRDAAMLQVNLTDAVSDEEARTRIMDTVPGVGFRSGRWIMATITEIATAMLAVQSVVAFAAMILSSIAVGTVIAANIQGRRFEYGVLRAVGSPRGVLLRLILGEAALLGITASGLGTIVGFHLAWMDANLLRSLAGLPVGVVVTVRPIAAGWVVLIALALLAALPSSLRLIRLAPRALIAAGRNE